MIIDAEDPNVRIKYLKNQLDPEQKEAFEVYLMDNPALLEELQLESTLVTTAPSLSFSGPEVASITNKTLLVKRAFDWWASIVGIGVGAVVTAFTFIVLTAPATQMLSTTSNIVFLETVRSGQKDIIPVNTDENGNLGLFLQTASLSVSVYELKINPTEQADQVLVRQQVKTNESGEILAIIQLQDIEHEYLTVSLTNQEALAIEQYKIRVVR